VSEKTIKHKGAKMTKLFISSVEVVEGYLYERMAEDGKIVVYDSFVRAICDGDVYDHEVIFKGAFKDEYEGYYHVDYNAKPNAERLASRVAEAGFINTDHWESKGNLSEIMKTQEERLEEAWSDVSDHYEN
jgi:hypothetical protein